MAQGDPPRPHRALLVYLAGLLLGAALLAPALWHLVHRLWPGSPMAGHPFHRYVNRCLLGLALGGLWPLLRALGVRSWAAIGAHRPGTRLGDWLRGLAFGWASLGLAALAVVGAGGRGWNTALDMHRWGRHVVGAIGTALVVSLLEELLFRGAIFSALRRTGSFVRAAAISSSLYAFVHFLQRPTDPMVIDATSGFTTLAQMLGGFLEWHLLVPGWITLLLAGWILALGRERTGHLAFSMGVHSGWIFWLKSYGFTTVPAASVQAETLWGSGRLYDGWVATVVLGLAAVVLHRRLRHRTP